MVIKADNKVSLVDCYCLCLFITLFHFTLRHITCHLSPAVVAEAPGATVMVVSVVGGGAGRLSPMPRLALTCPSPAPVLSSPWGRLEATWHLPPDVDASAGTLSFRYAPLYLELKNLSTSLDIFFLCLMGAALVRLYWDFMLLKL